MFKTALTAKLPEAAPKALPAITITALDKYRYRIACAGKPDTVVDIDTAAEVAATWLKLAYGGKLA